MDALVLYRAGLSISQHPRLFDPIIFPSKERGCPFPINVKIYSFETSSTVAAAENQYTGLNTVQEFKIETAAPHVFTNL